MSDHGKDLALAALFDNLVIYMTTPFESRVEFYFGLVLGARQALAMTGITSTDEHWRLCRMTEAAIDARHYLRTHDQGDVCHGHV